MNDFDKLTLATRQIRNLRPNYVADAVTAAYHDLMNSCEYEREDIVRELTRAAKRAGLTDGEIASIWQRIEDGDAIVPLAELLHPSLV